MTQNRHRHRFQKGLTLIEFMTVVVILGILVSIGVVQLIHAKERASKASIQSNMHAFQNVIELYAVDHGGLYPLSVDNMLNYAEFANSTVLFGMRNPLTRQPGHNQAYQDEGAALPVQGIVTLDGDSLSRYFIYAYDKDQLRIQIKGQDFILSNG